MKVTIKRGYIWSLMFSLFFQKTDSLFFLFDDSESLTLTYIKNLGLLGIKLKDLDPGP